MFFTLTPDFSGFELTSLSLLVGVIVATWVKRRTGVNPGGIIAAPMLILAAHTSLIWALFIPLVAILIARLYTRFFGHVYAGKTPLFILTFMSVGVMILIGSVLELFGLITTSGLSYPLGIILPAILANSINKQGIVRTFKAGAIALGITLSLLAAVYYAGMAAGYQFHDLDVRLEHRQLEHMSMSGLLYLASIAIGFIIYRRTGIKSAGFVVLPFLANLLIVSPLNFSLVLALAALAFCITFLLRQFTLIVGIGRYAFVFALSIVLVWTAEYVLLHTTHTFSPFLGTSIVASLVISVLVNEHSIYGFRKSSPLLLAGLGIMTVLMLASSYVAHAIG